MMIGIDENFDRLLGGGLRPGTLSLIYGSPASGKTNIALIAAIKASREGKVVYIDPEGGFSIDRLEQLTDGDTAPVLDNIILFDPADFDEQRVAIKKLDEIVTKEKVALVVIDSIGMLYRIQEERDIRELARSMAQLLRIARKYGVAVLVLNQVYTDFETGKNQPVGGDVIRYWAKVIIELEVVGRNRVATLRRHTSIREGMRLTFRITDAGIEKIGFSFDAPSTAGPKK